MLWRVGETTLQHLTKALNWASEATLRCSQAQDVRCRGLGRHKTAQNPCIVWGFNLTPATAPFANLYVYKVLVYGEGS